MNHSKYSLSNFKTKSRLTALQLLALVILPLFVFALVVKVQERQETESSADKIVSTQDFQQKNYMIKAVTHDSESAGNSHSAE
jgi:hypothetical protein